MQQIFTHTFANGFTLLAERMEHVRSASFSFLVPAGCIHDPPEQAGIATLLAEMITRGAGDRDSHDLLTALDNLGVDHGENVGGLHLHLSGATLARNLAPVLELYADILLRPQLPEEELDAVQALALQDLAGLEDEPASKLFIELRKRYYPAPLNQDHRGTVEGIKRVTSDSLRQHFGRMIRPRGSILTVAGNIEWEALRDQVGRLFESWPTRDEPIIQIGEPTGFGEYAHLSKDTTQTQIGIAYPSVPIGQPGYYDALAAVNILGGGMSSRLFTEVREKHALCYSISASYQTYRDRAAVLCYAGTTRERAQETLDRTVHELRRLRQGVEEDELERVRVGLKSSLIKQEESTSARAGSLGRDWYYLGRVRSIEEIQAAIQGLTLTTVANHLEAHTPERFTILTLGGEALQAQP